MRLPFRSLFAAALAAALSFAAGPAWAQLKQEPVADWARSNVSDDVQRAVMQMVMQTEDGLRAYATLKKLFDSRQQELNKRQTELRKQKEEIDQQSRALSRTVVQKKVDEWQKQMVELQRTFIEYNKEIEKKRKELFDPIFERVLKAFEKKQKD